MADGPKPTVETALYNTGEAAKWRGASRNTWLKECDELGLWSEPVVISGKRFWVVAELKADLERMKAQRAEKGL